jgi:hypothetical protein
MYGKPVTTVARTTYLIDAKGIIRARWDKKQIEADVPAHAGAVKLAVQALLKGIDPQPATEPVEKKTAKKKAPSRRG